MPGDDGTAVAALVALAAGLALTPAVRAAALRAGHVAHPKADRWHTQATPKGGGAAVLLAWLTALVATGAWRDVPALLAVAPLAFGLGLADDVVHLRPLAKLLGQAGCGALLLLAGRSVHVSGVPAVDAALTIFWVVAITNALNLIDNMDGLAAGVGAVAASGFAALFAFGGAPAPAAAAAALGGALVAFLAYNRRPASIFLGDSGSHVAGLLLAALGVEWAARGATGRLGPVAVPALILAVPIFDTLLVMISRRLRGRPVSQGGRDHTSHRLVYLGLGETGAVIGSWLAAVPGAAIGVGTRWLTRTEATVAAVAYIVALVAIGIRLGRLPVTGDGERPEPPAA